MATVIEWMERRPALARWVAPWSRTAYAFHLTLERRLWLFLGIDALLVLEGALDALIVGGKLGAIFSGSVFFPTCLLLLPALSGIVALERRSGSLDLALAAPSTERYFLRRVVPICALFCVQGFVLLICSYLETQGLTKALSWTSTTNSLLRALLQNVLLHVFCAAVVLFWATRLRTAGGVWAGSLVILLLFRPWLTADPLLTGGWGYKALLFGIPRPLLSWIGAMSAVAVGAAILYLYARERLRRPETMLD